MKKAPKRKLKLANLSAKKRKGLSEKVLAEESVRSLSNLAFAATLTGAAFFGGANEARADYTPTLDAIKSNIDDYLSGGHGTYELTTTAAEGAVPVTIGGTTYYFTPSESDRAYLSFLASTNDTFLKVAQTGDTAVLTLDGTNYTFDTAKAIGSAYTLTPTELTSGDNVINIPTYDPATKTTTNHYYTYAIKDGVTSQTRLSNKTDQSGTDFVGHYYNLSGNIYGGAIYNGNRIGNIIGDFINNSITNDDGGAIYNSSTIGDITGDFINNFASDSGNGGGGAIYNSGTIGNITGDFSYNSAKTYGGAIHNHLNAKIGNISGDFSNNSVTYFGGAIYNKGTIGDITGDFSNNSATRSGGAIYNENGTIGDITGNFINNSTLSDSGHGGAIDNYGTDSKIDKITGDFIHNSAASGGAINNPGTINFISGNFSNNSATGTGGAINNTTGTIGNITGDFSNNSATLSGGAIYNHQGTIGDITGDFSNNSTTGSGGAIFNTTGTIGSKTGDKLTGGIINANFLDNYAKTTSGTVHGGAIYTTKSMNLIADGNVAKNNGVSTISENYVEKNGVKDAEAIYIDSTSAVFQFLAKNGGKFVINDKINGTNGYTLNFTGDNKNEFNVNNTITGAKMTVDNADFNHDLSNNGTMDTDALNTLVVNDNSDFGFKIDFDATNKTSDKITTSDTSVTSSGTVLLEDINLTGDFAGWNANTKVQIINNLNTSSTLQLALTDELKESLPEFIISQNTSSSPVYDEIAQNTLWSDTYQKHNITTTTYGKLNLATTKTTNDSLGVEQTRVVNGSIDSAADTLRLVNLKSGERTFNAQSADDVYTVIEEIGGNMAEGTMTINGVADENGNRSTIDFDGQQGFYAQGQGRKLILNDVTITGANRAVYNNAYGEGAGVEINNVRFEDNTGNSGAIYNTKKIDSITAYFVNNSSQTSYSYGGAIYNNAGTIGNITGDFINNSATGSSLAYGGAICNNGTIGNISGNFTGNSTSASGTKYYDYGYGGAIYNTGTIGSVSGNFINNSASKGHGGAIYNQGTIGSVSGNFINNSATNGHGGAIYNSGTMTLLADGETYEISGNGARAIYNSNQITINAVNGGKWIINDGFWAEFSSREHGGTVNITGNTIGGVQTNYGISEQDINVEHEYLLNGSNLQIGSHGNYNITFNIMNQDIGTMELNKFVVYGSNRMKFKLDADFSGAVGANIDKFIVSGDASGTLYVDAINFLGERNGEFTGQVLKLNGSQKDLKLAFGDSIVFFENGIENNVPVDESGKARAFIVDDTVTYGQIYANADALRLYTTDTENDSIAIRADGVFDQILTYLNQKGTENVRNFNFLTANDVYTVGEEIGITAAGELHINGVADNDGNRSTIDFGGTSGFYNESNKPVKLVLQNVKLTNAASGNAAINNDGINENNNNWSFGQNKYVVTDTDGSQKIVYTAGYSYDDSNFRENLESGRSYAHTNNTYENLTFDEFVQMIKNQYGSPQNHEGQRFTPTSVQDFIDNWSCVAQTTDFNDYAQQNTTDLINVEISGHNGGAVRNFGIMNTISGIFTGNSTNDYGGVIYNTGTIGNIAADFTDNSAGSYGGVIYNENSTIGNITGDFINNSADSHGGAIYNNNSTIGDIVGKFYNNSVLSSYSGAYGGAIYNNNGKLGNITADTSNPVTVRTPIYGEGIGTTLGGKEVQKYPIDIEVITFVDSNGDAVETRYIANGDNGSMSIEEVEASGELIYYYNNNYQLNDGQTVDDYISNNWDSQDAAKISTQRPNNEEVIGVGAFNFCDNEGNILEQRYQAYDENGNQLTLEQIENSGKKIFIYNADNRTVNSADEIADVLANDTWIAESYSIAQKPNNEVALDASDMNHTALAYKFTIIDSDGTEHTVYDVGYPDPETGNRVVMSADDIANSDRILVFDDSQIIDLRDPDNWLTQDYGVTTYEAAIAALADDNGIDESYFLTYDREILGYNEEQYSGFYKNIARANDQGQAAGGAIYNQQGLIGDITADFVENGAGNTLNPELATNAAGGAIYNDRKIGNITGDFVRNYAVAGHADGGAIYNTGIIGNINGDFIENYAITAVGGNSGGDSGVVNCGGAIYNNGTIENITGDFIGNHYEATNAQANGGAIYNLGEIGDIKGNFTDNYAISNNMGEYSNNGSSYSSSSGYENSGGYINTDTSSGSGYANAGGAIYNGIYVSAQEQLLQGNRYQRAASIEELINQDGYNISSNLTNGNGKYFNYNITTDEQLVDQFISSRSYSSAEDMARDYGYSSVQQMLNSYGYQSMEEYVNKTGNHKSYTDGNELVSDWAKYRYNTTDIDNAIDQWSYDRYSVGTYDENNNWVAVYRNNVTLDEFLDAYAKGQDSRVSGMEEYLAKYNYSSVAEVLANYDGYGRVYYQTKDEAMSAWAADKGYDLDNFDFVQAWLNEKNIYDNDGNKITTMEEYAHSRAWSNKLQTTLNFDSAQEYYEALGVDNAKDAIAKEDGYNSYEDYINFQMADYNATSEAELVYSMWHNGYDVIYTQEQAMADFLAYTGLSSLDELPTALGYATSGNIGAIEGDFTHNTITSADGLSVGGAIANFGKIKSIKGNFVENAAVGAHADGGAIYNAKGAEIGDIEGNFVRNYAFSNGILDEIISGGSGSGLGPEPNRCGGALHNAGTIGDITGDFIENHYEATDAQGNGGAIYNEGTIGNIVGNFTNNYAVNQKASILLGGKEITTNRDNHGYGDTLSGYKYIFSDKVMYELIADNASSFDNSHYVLLNDTYDYSDITAQEFINSQRDGQYSGYRASYGYEFVEPQESNSYTSNNSSHGGAVFNSGKMGDITGDFTNNRVEGLHADGGAIFNTGTIGNIVGNFRDNLAISNGFMEDGHAISQSFDVSGSGSGSGLDDHVVECGGAIYNSGEILTIAGDFVNNRYQATEAQGNGGAVYNTGSIGEIAGNFVDNSAQSANNSSFGGAIYNSGIFKPITAYGEELGTLGGKEIQQYDDNIDYDPDTTALASKIIIIDADGTEHIVYNVGYTDPETGNWVQMSADDIANSDRILVDDGSDIFDLRDPNNPVVQNGGSTYEAAIAALADDWEIDESYLLPSDREVLGVAGSGNITGNFVNNTITSALNAQTPNEEALSTAGGAIANFGTMGDITADTTRPVTVSTPIYGEELSTLGGKEIQQYDDNIDYDPDTTAFAYKTTIIDADGTEHVVYDVGYDDPETGNWVVMSADDIANSDRILVLEGSDIIDLRDPDTAQNFGGATTYEDVIAFAATNGADFIAYDREITGYNERQVTGFYGNSATSKVARFDHIYKISSDDSVAGGAIANYGTMGNITADFENNSATIPRGFAYGGAIANFGTMGDITGDFTGNWAVGAHADGGAIFNAEDAVIGNITGDFTGNWAWSKGESSRDQCCGGAINNQGTIGDIIGNFTGNYYKVQGVNAGNFENTNGIEAHGGAIYNTGSIASINGAFTDNYTTADRSGALGGAIYNDGTIDIITGDFMGNYAKSDRSDAYGGAIYNEGTIDIITGNFNSNSTTTDSYAYGGAIYNDSEMTIVNSSFTGNYTTSTNGEAYGGAISNGGEMNLVAQDGYTSTINGNYVQDSNGRRDEAIYNVGNLTITAQTGGKFVIDDVINNNGGNTLVFNGDSTGVVDLNNNIVNMYTGNDVSSEYSVQLNDITLNLNKESNLNGAKLTVNSGIISTINNEIGTMELVTLTSDQNAKYNIDVNIAEQTGDMFSVNNEYAYNGSGGYSNGIVYLNNLNILGDMVEGQTYKIQILDVNDGGAQLRISESIESGVAIVPDEVTYGDSYRGTGGVRLATTNTLNDSIEFTLGNEVNDVLSAINDKVSDGAKAFDFVDQNDNYVVENGLNKTEGDLTINGVTTDDGSAGSTIDLNGNNGFDVGTGANLNINDTQLTGAEGTAVNIEQGATAELNNVSIVDNKAMGAGSAVGAAVVNNGTMGDITGTIADNTSTSTDDNAYGGAVTNNDTAGTVAADFTNNKAEGEGAQGGGLYNEGTTQDVTGDFSGNSAVAHDDGGVAEGGAIANAENAEMGDVTGDFSGNSAVAHGNGGAIGGAIANAGNAEMGDVTGDFSGNSATAENNAAEGGAIYNLGEIGEISGSFTNNSTTSENNGADGGAIFNWGTTGDVTGDYSGNSATSTNEWAAGGAITNLGTTGDVTGNFSGNSAQSTDDMAFGGAISNTGEMGEITGSFTNNSATSENGEAYGGAIYSTGDITIAADNSTSEFTGNYTESNGERDDNAIYLDSSDATLTLNTKNNGEITLNDNVRGEDGYSVDITGDGTGTINLMNDLHNANVSTGDATINTIDNQTHTYNVKSLTVKGDTKMQVDVDLANSEMDRFTADSYGSHTGTLTVNGMNLLSDATQDVTEIMFAQAGLKDVVRTTVTGVGAGSGNTYQTTMYSPIFKYNVLYDNRSDAGYFVFAKGNQQIIVDPTDPNPPVVDPTDPTRPIIPSNGGGGKGYHTVPNANPSSAFNPAVLTTAVSNQAAAISTLNHTFEYAFEHSDGFMALPELERFAQINANSVALSTDFNENMGHIDVDHLNKAIWARPYTAFESIPLRNGPKVDSISYGTLVGGDTNIKKLKHGWAKVDSAYIGYHGSQLKYGGVDSSTNGGLLGLTETFYKGNFFTALTLSAGAGVAENHTMYGKDDNTFLMAGLASKTGYNFEFVNGKFIIQPLLHMNYTMVKTFDYTNAAGVRINSDAAHNVQIAPTIKFIGNFESGWQPYASVGMVWDVLHEQNTTANGIKLPNMYTKPYVQYGVGIQRCWNDRFSAYGQAMVRNGGRSGIALNFGFRWALGNKTVDELTQLQKEKKAQKEAKKMMKQAQNNNLKLDGLKESVNVQPKASQVLKKSETTSSTNATGAAAKIQNKGHEVKVHNATHIPTKKLSLKQLNTD